MKKKYLLSWHHSQCLNFSTCLLEKKLKSLNKQKFSLISFIGPKTVLFQRITCSKKSAVFSISVSVYRTGKSLGAS